MRDFGAAMSRFAAPPSGLESAGGQFGLAAMRDRVLACGGSLEAGPNPAGGWLVQALLPARLG